MSQYVFILIWILAMFAVRMMTNVGYEPVDILGRKEYRVSKGFAVFAFAPVIPNTLSETVPGTFVPPFPTYAVDVPLDFPFAPAS